MIVEVGGKSVAAAVGDGHEIEVLVLFGRDGRGQGTGAERADGAGRQAGTLVGVVDVVGVVQMAAAQVAVKVGPQPVDDRGVGLERHVDAQTVGIDAGHARPLVGKGGLLLHDGSQDHQTAQLVAGGPFAVGPEGVALAPEVVHHAAGHGTGLGLVGHVGLLEQIGVRHEEALGRIEGDAVVAQKGRVRDDGPEILKAYQPGIFQHLGGLPPGQAFGHGDAEQHRLAVDQGIQHLFRQPARIEGKAAGLQAAVPLFVAGQQQELARIGDEAAFFQLVGHTAHIGAGFHVEEGFLPRCGRGRLEEGPGLVPRPAGSGRRQQDKDSHDAQYGLHAGLRWSGLRERKDSRMRTAACWSSTALQRRPVRPTSRSSRSAASELSSSDMK